jgi:alkylresorcinol/alkylpyrone synthase
MLRNILSPLVPELAADRAEQVLSQTLRDAGIDRNSVACWVFHPGGRDVIIELKRRLGLGDAELQLSADVLRDFGNLSSPSVLFVLQRTLASETQNGLWWLSSFGAGFTCHGALLEAT